MADQVCPKHPYHRLSKIGGCVHCNIAESREVIYQETTRALNERDRQPIVAETHEKKECWHCCGAKPPTCPSCHGMDIWRSVYGYADGTESVVLDGVEIDRLAPGERDDRD